jgi:hypothetical protein
LTPLAISLVKNSIFYQNLREKAGCMEQGRDFNEKIVFWAYLYMLIPNITFIFHTNQFSMEMTSSYKV